MIYGIQVDLTMTHCFSFENMEDLTIEHGDLGHENWRIQHKEKLGFKYQINQINHIFLFIFVHSHLQKHILVFGSASGRISQQSMWVCTTTTV